MEPSTESATLREHMSATDGAVEEFKALRQQVLQIQQERLYILGFASAAVGVVLGLVPTPGSAGMPGTERVGLIVFGQLVVFAAGILTVQRAQSIVWIAEYIRVFLEGEHTGLRWETRIRHYRMLGTRRHRKLGASRSFATYFLLVALSLAGLGWTIARLTWGSIPIAILLVLDLMPCVNLWRQKSFRWRFNWEFVRDHEQARVTPGITSQVRPPAL